MPAGSGVSGRALADSSSGRSSRWNDLSARIVSALVLLPVVLFCVWTGGYAFLLVITAAGLGLAFEWLVMCGFTRSDPAFFWFPAVILAVAIAAGLGFAWVGLSLGLIASVAAMLGGSTLVASRASPTPLLRHGPDKPGHDEREGPGRDGGEWPGHDEREGPGHSGLAVRAKFNLAFGIPYIGLAAVALPWLREDPDAGLANTLFILVLIWTSDIGAYAAGRLIGGAKLAPVISPGKTWSGALGGLVCAALASLAFTACFTPGFSALHVIGLAIGLGVISQAGDLLESALKRHFGVKDSGRIIPGHGGLLDRLDSLLAVAPAAALLAFTVGRGVVLWR